MAVKKKTRSQKKTTKKTYSPYQFSERSMEFGFRSYKPIENYGIIGDFHSVALVGMDGSIDWCCLPHFDSPSIFASILDCQKGGFFKIAPMHSAVQKQMYLPESCVLTTRFLNPGGVAEVIDFMPVRERVGEQKHTHQIIRRIRGVRGSLKFKMRCEPAFNYARDKHTIQLKKAGAIFSTKSLRFGLLSPLKLNVVDRGVECEFVVNEGQVVDFILRHVEPHSPKGILDMVKGGVDEALDNTHNFWRRWSKSVKYNGRWREMVKRSAMTLKLMTFAPTGAIVAAPTTSLPEDIGGERNWDYRYTWIRDAAFTIYAFIRLGLTREAEQFMHWIDARCHEERKDGSMQIMYSIHGKHKLDEHVLKHLEGYRGSSPVRIGNGAYKQLQLDIYGELMDSAYLFNKYTTPISYDLWQHLRRQLNYVCKNWKRKDEGIWEVRGGRKHFVYSKLMCWVALDRGIRLVHKRSFPGERLEWYKARDQIYEEIMSKGWNNKLKSFVQYYGADVVDASNLIMPLVFFIAPTDPRMLTTIDLCKSRLAQDSLVYRYRVGEAAHDGLTAPRFPPLRLLRRLPPEPVTPSSSGRGPTTLNTSGRLRLGRCF